jgi:hypothetical protein
MEIEGKVRRELGFATASGEREQTGDGSERKNTRKVA